MNFIKEIIPNFSRLRKVSYVLLSELEAGGEAVWWVRSTVKQSESRGEEIENVKVIAAVYICCLGGRVHLLVYKHSGHEAKSPITYRTVLGFFIFECI